MVSPSSKFSKTAATGIRPGEYPCVANLAGHALHRDVLTDQEAFAAHLILAQSRAVHLHLIVALRSAGAVCMIATNSARKILRSPLGANHHFFERMSPNGLKNSCASDFAVSGKQGQSLD